MQRTLNLFEAPQAVIQKIDAPLLVIGLGGTGAQGLIRVKDTFRKHFIHDTAPNGDILDDPPRTAYLAIDTDGGTRNINWNGTRLDANTEFLHINDNIADLLDPGRHMILPWEKDWLDSRMSAWDIDSGGGTIRQVARLALIKKTTALTGRLTTIISNLVRVSASAPGGAKRINVAVITGLCGATGSGTFLDVAYLVRHVCQTSFANSRLDLTAYLYMPDVTMEAQGVSDGPKAQIYAYNGFSALKELDYWMNVSEHKEYHLQKYSQSVSQLWNVPPFDMCTLLCASKADGTMIRKSADVVSDVLAENMLHYYADEAASIFKSGIEQSADTAQGGVDTFGFQSERSNSYAAVNMLDKPLPQPYVYRSIGAFSNSGEQQDMLNYEAYMTFRHIVQSGAANAPVMEGNDPDAFMDEIFETSFSAARNATPFMTEFENNTPWDATLFSRTGIYTPQALKTLDLNEAMHKAPYEAYKRTVRQAIPALMNAREELLWEGFRRAATAAIIDPKRGPAWLETMLASSRTGILAKLQSYIEKIRTDYGNTHNALIGLEGSALDQLYDAYVNAGLLSRNSAFTQYAQNAEALYNYFQHEAFFAAWVKTLESVHARVSAYCHNALRLYNQAIIAIEKDLSEKTSQGSVREHHFINVQSLRAEIERIFHDEPVRERLMENVMRGIAACSFAGTENLNVYEDAADIMIANFSQFIQDTYNQLGSMSLDDLIRSYGGDPERPVTDVARYVQETLAKQMANVAQPMFAAAGAYNGLDVQHAVKFGYISVPAGAPQTKAGIEAFIEQSDYKGALIKSSRFTDRIFWLNASVGMPLSAYEALARYEALYEQNLPQVAGMHLVRTRRTQDMGDCRYDWHLLPTPYLRKVMGGGAPTEEAARRDNEIRDTLKAARECGVLVIQPDRTCQLSLLANDVYVENTYDQTAAFAALTQKIEEGIATAAGAGSTQAVKEALLQLIAPDKKALRTIDIPYVDSKINSYMSYLRLGDKANDPQARQESYYEVLVDVLSGYPVTLREVRLNIALIQKVQEAIRACDDGADEHARRKAAASKAAYMMMFGVIKILPRMVLFRNDEGAYEDKNGEDNLLFGDDKNVGTFQGYEFLPIHLRLVHWLAAQKEDAYPLYIIERAYDTELRAFNRMEEDDERRAAFIKRAKDMAARIDDKNDELRRARDDYAKQVYDEARELLSLMSKTLNAM